jgi:hypothetical protein
MGKAQAWSEYLAWNRAVADVIYPETPDAVPVYMDLEDEELAAIGRAASYGGAEPAAALADVVTAVTVGPDGKFGLDAVVSETRAWVAQQAKASGGQAPPCIAYLALTCLAAEAMGNDAEDLASLAYYARLARLLKLPDDDAGLRSKYPQHAEYLWRCLNRWLESLDGERGLPTAYALTYRFVGLPMSQALVRDHDRRRFPFMFAQYGLSPGMRLAPEDLVRYLDAWLTEGSTASSNLRRLWNRTDSHERIASIAGLELANWDGTVAGEVSATSRLAAKAMVIATLRNGFLGSSLDLSLGLRSLAGAMDGSMQVRATDGTWLPLTFSPGTAGLWRTAYTESIDFRSMLEGAVRIRHPDDEEGPQYTHHPRMVIPLVYDELQSAFVEAERLQLGVDAMVLVRSAGTTKASAGAVEEVESILEQSARPGFKKVEETSGLPEGWALFTDVQLFGAPAATTKFNELVPMARNQLTVAGGLRIPSRIRKWSTLSPPEIRATVQSETNLRITLSDSMGEQQIAEWSSETGGLVVSLHTLALADGDYQAALFAGKKTTPIQQASIRLRSADKVDVHWEDAPRLTYFLEGPLGVLTAVENARGSRLVDGLVAQGTSGVEATVPAGNKIIWDEPEVVVKSKTIEIGSPDPTSCVVTGAHRILLPPAMGGHAPKFIQGECSSCGLVKRYPGWLPRNGWSKKNASPTGQSVASEVAVSELSTVREDDVDWDAALDALMHLGGGAISALQSIAMQLEGSALFADTFIRSLEALGHISIERDEKWQPTRWEISPPCLGQQASGEYRLAGYWPQSYRQNLESFAAVNGGLVGEDSDANCPTLYRLAGITEGAAHQFGENSTVAVAAEAGIAILRSLPALSAVSTGLPRITMPGYQTAERFDLNSAGWVSTGDPIHPGAYRLRRGFETIYVYRSLADVDAGTAATAPVHLVKHLAANDRGLSLVTYLEAADSVIVPQGCDLPGLYARAAVAVAGHLPVLKNVSVKKVKRKCLVYEAIDRPSADLLNTLLST